MSTPSNPQSVQQPEHDQAITDELGLDSIEEQNGGNALKYVHAACSLAVCRGEFSIPRGF